MNTQNLNEILLQVNKLDKADQAILLKRITKMVNTIYPPIESIPLTQLAGLGSSLWQNLDIDKYVDEEDNGNCRSES